MVLIDTSVWISFFNKGDKQFSALLEEGKVATHEFIFGELSCGNIKNRNEILSLINELPKSPVLTFSEISFFIESHKLYGIGLGLIDCHLLSSALISDIKLWTNDKTLKQTAAAFGISYF